MIITALGKWTPEPGRLLEWHPSPQARALARSAPVHDIGPSFLQEDHLRTAAAAAGCGDLHHAYTAATAEIDGCLDRDAFSRAIGVFVRRHEGLRCWFEMVDGVAHRRLAGAGAAEFVCSDVGGYRTDEEFQRYVRARFAAEASPFDWPGFAVGAVERSEDFTLYYAADHAYTDGVSHALAIGELADLYAREIGVDPDRTDPDVSEPELPRVGSHLDYAEQERARAALHATGSPEIASWKEIFDRHDGKMPRFPLDLGLPDGSSGPVRIVERHLLDARGTDAFDRACKAAGARVSSGVFAAVAITDYELAERENYFGITVLSTRHLGNYDRSQGWFVNFAPVAFPVADAHDFSAVARRAHESFERAKQIAAVPVHAVLRFLAADGTLGSELAVSPNMLSYIDFRWFHGSGTPADSQAKQMTGEGRTSNASMWINRDADHLYLCAQVPDNDVAAASVERYHAHLQNVLDTVARDGEYAVRVPDAVGSR